jgi:Na+/alanine symporter
MNPKLWHPHQLNVWQYLALVGLVMTAAAHGLLQLSHKVVPGFNYLYAVWAAVYVLGSIRNVLHVPGPDDHHH